MIAAAELVMFEVWGCQRLGRVPAPLEPHLEPRQIVEIRLGVDNHTGQLRLHCSRETAAALAHALWTASGTQLSAGASTTPAAKPAPSTSHRRRRPR